MNAPATSRASRWNAAMSAATIAALARQAAAHSGDGAAAGFASGLSHPVSGMDHVAAMLAVGLWGAQLGAPAAWVLPVAFPLVMALGGLLGLLGVALPGVEIGIAVSAIALGAMVLLEAKPPLALAIAMVAVFAIFHGHAHGTELPESQDAIAYSIGFVIATGLLHLVGIGIGTAHRWKQGRLALRAAGVAIVAAGAWFLWGAMA